MILNCNADVLSLRLHFHFIKEVQLNINTFIRKNGRISGNDDLLIGFGWAL